ncbi:helix-turn-helix domain-containing protein [Kitasatospora sp. NPDC004272]
MDTAPGPLDIDPVAINLVLHGHHPLPALTRDEQHYAAQLLRDTGITCTAIARRLGVAPTTIRQWTHPGPRQPRHPQPCPSRAAYRRHLAAGETCPACRAANAAADQRYRHTGTTLATAA